jgi:hypothetical protein
LRAKQVNDSTINDASNLYDDYLVKYKKNIDLSNFIRYYFFHAGEDFSCKFDPERLPRMKLAIRIFAFSVVIAGAAAAAVAPKSAPVIASHQSATANLPIAACGPRFPGCVVNPSPRN